MDGWMDGWMDEWMDGWMDGLGARSAGVSFESCQLRLARWFLLLGQRLGANMPVVMS